MQINLNADLGESFGPWPMGDDKRLLKVVGSANVACGFHAGDSLVMRSTVAQAVGESVSIGAHPGFHDLQGFGRRAMSISHDQLTADMLYQLGALDAMCIAANTRMTPVKPHGALNNLACENRQLADTLAQSVAMFRTDLILLAPVLSELASAGEAAGLKVALEVFADRAYADNGSLMSRQLPGAVLDNTPDCIANVLRMLEAQGIVTAAGKVIKTPFHSVCVHGDNAHAVDTATQIRQALIDAGHQIQTLPELLGS